MYLCHNSSQYHSLADAELEAHTQKEMHTCITSK